MRKNMRGTEAEAEKCKQCEAEQQHKLNEESSRRWQQQEEVHRKRVRRDCEHKEEEELQEVKVL